MKFHTTLLYGSVRHHRQGIKGARFLETQLKERGHDVTLIDPMESQYQLPFLDKMYKEFQQGEAPENMERIAEHLRNSDGFVVVTAEYNHSLPPALKNLLDHFQEEYLFKPSAIACYSAGSFGGVRAAVHLRAVLGELGTPSISSMFPMPQVGKAFLEDGTPQEEAYYRRADRFLKELEWYEEALKQQREKGTPF